MMRRYLISLMALLACAILTAQNVFEKEVKETVAKNDALWQKDSDPIVFAGSSSFRLWKDLKDRFSKYPIINSGFGGSQASDLDHFLDELVLHYNPKQVFIYEGDNDINAKKKPKAVSSTLKKIIDQIKSEDSDTKIVLLSAKPSISRWHLRGKYKRLNKKIQQLAANSPNVEFIDVWNPLLNGRRLRTDIFIEDGLHLNKKGYDIWEGLIRPFLE